MTANTKRSALGAAEASAPSRSKTSWIALSARFRTWSAVVAIGAAAPVLTAPALAAEPSDSGKNNATAPAMAVYRWPNGTANVDAFAGWLGRPNVWGEDFIGSESWSNVGWPVWWLKTWSEWTHKQPGRRLILGVPLLAGPVDGSGPTKGDSGVGESVSLEKAAAGAYNHHFKQLAENLVAHKLGDTILRLGWEFNGDWYTWRAAKKEALFAEYWRQIVKTMRSVPGTEKLKFCWNPTLGYQQFPAERAWPGDAFVDLVGVDVYDETWERDTYPWPPDASATEIAARQRKVWHDVILGGDHGLAFWSKYAREHGKPLAIMEWGLKNRTGKHCGMDNPYFVEKMHQFINDKSNNVFVQCYFDVDCPIDEGHHQLSPGEKGTHKTDFPQAAVKFQELFGAKPPAGSR